MAEYIEIVDAIFERAIEQYEEVIAGPGGLVLVVGQGEHLGIDDLGLALTNEVCDEFPATLDATADRGPFLDVP